MSHDHDHADGHDHDHAEQEQEWEVEELDAEEVDRLVAEGKLVQVEGPEGEPLFIDADMFAEGVRLDLAENTENPEYLIGVGGLLLDGGHAELSLAAAELALAAAPGNEEALLLAGIASARLQRLDVALARLDDHLAAVPSSSLGHTHRAHVLLALGRDGEAHAAARRALSLDRNDVGAVQALVAGPDGPEAALRRTVELAREIDGWGVLRVAGDLAATLGDETSAIAHWKRAVELGADDATAGNLLAQLGQAGRIDELVAIADSLPRLAERDPGLRWNAAAGYEAAGRSEEARIVFASIAHDPEAAPDVRAAARDRLGEE